MYCPRLDHFVRINTNGTIGCCGHMTKPKQFDSVKDLHASKWLSDIKMQMYQDTWPAECVRCERTEQINGTSIRINSIKRDSVLKGFDSNYLQLGGTLDNYCNSACVTCNPTLSTRIGSLKNNSIINDNWDVYQQLPHDRLVEIDINGGEPSISVNYNRLLDQLPDNVRIVRINTNGATAIKQIDKLLNKGVKVIVTVSFDGIGAVHDYVRYPVKWNMFEQNLMYYNNINNRLFDLDCWTTVSCLNVKQLPEIKAYCKEHKIKHQFALLNTPNVLSVDHSNWFTADTPYGTGNDNTLELESFLELEESVRPGIERFWQ